MNVQGSVAFVTGANRGLGLALAKELVARGAKKVYAGVRDPGAVNVPGVVAVHFDVDEGTRAIKATLSTGQANYLNPSVQ